MASSGIVFLSIVVSVTTLAARDAGPGQAGQGPPPIETLLARAGKYVGQFIERFANVVAEERYVQDTQGNLPSVPLGGRGFIQRFPSGAKHRELKSDFLLVKIGPAEWMPFRDVFEIDGTPIRDREQRLAKLFLQPTGAAALTQAAVAQAQQITDESTRFNLGAMQRTINTPILTLMLLQLEMQNRVRFSLGKRDASAGENVWVVEYKEEARPTLVRGLANIDVPASGRFWIEGETGRVVRAEIALAAPGVRARVTTSYRLDERFQIDVPVEMREHYDLDRGQVNGTASYGRFRRFDVNADETFHNPAAQTITDKRTGIVLIEMPSGRFTMGSPASELGRRADETLHDVTINRPFFIGQHEITQQEWRIVMGTNASRFADCGPRCPVENVGFADVEQFLAALNAQVDHEVLFRLPTEAEWEYACRAGTTTRFSTGDTLTTAQANYNGKQPDGGAAPGLFRERPTRAGGFPANAWGLVDMHGNVWEWTADWYGAYPSEDVADPPGPPSGDQRVIRGGSWQADANSARCAARAAHDPDARDSALGFRVAADRKQDPAAAR
jgi:formylglycine-generating enzyme required for sulfatase activity